MSNELIGTNCFEHFKTNDCNTEKCATAKAFQLRNTSNSETTAKPGNKQLDLRYTSVPLTDENGHVVAAFEMFVDETEIKTAMRLNEKLGDYRQRQTEKIVDALNNLAEGNFAFNIELDTPDNDLIEAHELFSKIVSAINTTKSSIGNLSNDAFMLSNSAANGHLDVRADTSKHKGEYKKIIEGFNGTLDNLIRPMNVAAEYVDRISKGDIPPKITDDYKGDFNELKNNLNTCIDAIGALVADIKVMSDAAIEGKLDTRSDTARHHGDFRKIMQGMNETLDAVVTPLSIAANYIDKIAKGDLSNRIDEEFAGDFNDIKDNINLLIDNLQSFVNEVKSVTDAHHHGEITVYLDTEKANGFYLEMNKEVNSWVKHHIDNVLHILDVIHSYAEGDLSRKVNRFPGKQAIAHERIDLIQENLTNVVNELNTIIEAAQNGKLDIRGKDDNFKGAYKSIVSGLNDTLDAVVKPIRVTADYIEKLAEGIIPPKVTDEYRGDFNLIISNLNNLISNMNGLYEEIGVIINGIGVGKLDTRGKASRFKGSWQDLVSSLNEIVAQVEAPILELVSILKKISVNDYTHKVTNNYQGIWDELKTATNDTMLRLENVLSILKDASVGNLNRLAEIRSIGRRSENDELIPSFVKLMETIELLAKDAKMLADSAIQGDLSTRADDSQHFGEYKTIVQGFNHTLDALNEPIEEAGQVLNVMSTGDLTARMLGNYKGDHKKLKDSINTLAESLNDLVGRILDSVETTASATVQISSTADTIATSSQEQSAQTEEVASAIEEMARTVTDNANNAQKTADMARQNREVAKDGGEIVKQTVTKMSDIANVVKQSAENIEKLGESSKQIGEIISVIDDIADQTNLLALNAAIEAARAGEQGRGFAVVADEVRKLAERTTEATKKIAQMIKGIQKETENAVSVMQSGNSEVTHGIKLADQAGESLKEIVTSSQHLLDMISQIATASEEQAATGEQITKNVAMISDVTHDSSRRITEIAHSSEDLSRLTEELRALVSQFRIQAAQEQLSVKEQRASIGGGRHKRFLNESNY